MSVLNCRTRECFVLNRSGACVAMPGLFVLVAKIKIGGFNLCLMIEKWVGLLLLATARAWFSSVDCCHFLWACSVCQRSLLPRELLKDFVLEVDRRVAPFPSTVLFSLSTVGAISCPYSQLREENGSEGEDSDATISILIPVKISEENSVYLGNSFVSLRPGVRVGRWQKRWTNWRRGWVWNIGIGPECLFCLKTVQVAVSSAGSGFQHPNGDESTSCLVGTLQE